jgi:hypothetical protein
MDLVKREPKKREREREREKEKVILPPFSVSGLRFPVSSVLAHRHTRTKQIPIPPHVVDPPNTRPELVLP